MVSLPNTFSSHNRWMALRVGQVWDPHLWAARLKHYCLRDRKPCRRYLARSNRPSNSSRLSWADRSSDTSSMSWSNRLCLRSRI